MKKVLLIILYLLPLTISAQTEENIIPSDTTYFPPGTWWIQVEEYAYRCELNYYAISDADTIIDDKVYHLIETKFGSYYKEDNTSTCYGPRYESYVVREENEKVYLRWLNKDGDKLTYDFSDDAWIIGDTLPMFDFPITTLTETELLDKNLYKTWDYEGWKHWELIYPERQGTLIKGIGHTGGLGIFIWGIDGPTFGWRTPGMELYCFSRRGQKLYQSKRFDIDVEALLQVGTTVGVTNTVSKNKSDAIYDLSGRKLTEKPQKGFYIQGGRKYIAR